MERLPHRVAYNAAATKDAQSDETFRGALSKFAAYPGMSDAVHSAVVALLHVPSISKKGQMGRHHTPPPRKATSAIATEP